MDFDVQRLARVAQSKVMELVVQDARYCRCGNALAVKRHYYMTSRT
jgi:hypothetical protein